MLDLLDSFSTGTHITKKLVRRKGDELKSLALRKRSKYESDIEQLRASVLRKVQRLEDRLSSSEIISTGEKLTFSFGLLNVFYAGFLMGAYPEYFHLFYTIELMALLPIRFYTYKRKQYHYFLADLCYFVNLLNLLYIWLLPESAHLFISCYALSFGTLSWAVITWRNSLVLHSIDKTTSSFIHILPPAVFHVITHQLDPEFKAARFAGAQKFDQWQTITGILSASLAYLVWQSLYHYFITLKRQEKIKAGRATSFEYLRKSYAKTPLGKFVNGLPEPLPVVAFTIIQYSYQLCTMLLCPIWYSHSVLSALFVTFIFFWASLNGATYYIDIFGKRFQKQLLELQAEVADWKDKDEANHAKHENDSDRKPENDSDEKPENDSDEKSEHDSDEKSEHDNNPKPEHDSETKLDKDIKEKTK
ncbi:hypothetical protein DV451_002221 [Geotrichum candidum]|uniref:Glycerophosphocholine acyltransferase 1 n=1 Tax=Geotrichum candidum TaxID=1173061 RepID=A0A9P5KSX3_GEOCN|nr:hypothetical protein DV451_002221 [Geotrichum candidum]KAF5111223.1 hypothetical protein DV453_000464 [Geotrichum candidum]